MPVASITVPTSPRFRFARSIATASGLPITFLFTVAAIVGWAVRGPVFHFNNSWQLVINTGTTIITFLMVFMIQNTQNRDPKFAANGDDPLFRFLRTNIFKIYSVHSLHAFIDTTNIPEPKGSNWRANE